MILETKRLYLREMNPSDFNSLCRILQDEKAMYAYEGAFSDQEVQEWLDRQIYRYQKWNFGLWAVILKETNEMIGQCGLTMQPWKDKEVLEIGYLLARPYWHKGYAIEAAKARNCDVLICDTARRLHNKKNLMQELTMTGTWTKHYRGVDMPHYRYVVSR